MNKDRRYLQYRLIIVAASLVVISAFASWLVWSNSAINGWLFRLYNDHEFMRAMVERWGVFAPLAFILILALQVIISPIPGDVTGVLGGFIFGQRLGFIYSTIGLTIGSLFAFWFGRRLGAPFVKRLTGPKVWQRLDFIVEAEGAILGFIVFLVPGIPKDILCYLFGVSPLPFWVFAVVSTLGRMPGTWVLSAGGAEVAEAQYAQLLILIAVVAALMAACQRGVALRTPESARWVSLVCSSQADLVTLNAGPSKDDTTAFAQWKRGDGSRAFALPTRVQNLQKIHLEANNSPQGRDTEMCVKFDNRPKKRVSFSKSENHTIDANSADDTKCQC